ncbi:glucose-1-phosphate cytidylyltransferase [Clostridium sp. YIM B02551]|uniref:glucose-1-phosphate cytidylyltransferase n=1 Tax=Clostridium sp. YIM B02551 TaxID=2910679 RepID=UPI001EEC29E0|nr:glucose-1-phosphate cytidylyltransferase [Clostridium sp. YIM B02551]
MKAVIFCGGKGTRMREETEYRPKPLVLVGGKPILWHIMKLYSHYGIDEFILCLGYKGDMIKQYFMEMYWRNNDFTLNINGHKEIEYHTVEKEKWKITFVDTGLETLTGGRLKKIEPYIDEDSFMLTYGDGLSDVNLNQLINYHNSKGKIATLTGVHPISNYGLMEIEDGIVKAFREKPVLKDLVNGGYMVLNKEIFSYLPSEDCMFEQEPLINLAADTQLTVYEHNGYWTAIDTFKDVESVNKMCENGEIPWKVWD